MCVSATRGNNIYTWGGKATYITPFLKFIVTDACWISLLLQHDKYKAFYDIRFCRFLRYYHAITNSLCLQECEKCFIFFSSPPHPTPHPFWYMENSVSMHMYVMQPLYSRLPIFVYNGQYKKTCNDDLIYNTLGSIWSKPLLVHYHVIEIYQKGSSLLYPSLIISSKVFLRHDIILIKKR